MHAISYVLFDCIYFNQHFRYIQYFVNFFFLLFSMSLTPDSTKTIILGELCFYYW